MDHTGTPMRNFRRNAGVTAALALPSLVCLIASALLWRTADLKIPAFYAHALARFLSSPFAGASGLRGGLLRIFFYALPSLLSAAALLLSVLSKRNPKRSLGRVLSALMILHGIRIASILSCFSGGTAHGPSLPCTVHTALSILSAACLFLYAYRTALCILRGFPKKSATPGTFGRFVSFTARYLLWSLLLMLVQIGTSVLFSLD